MGALDELLTKQSKSSTSSPVKTATTGGGSSLDSMLSSNKGQIQISQPPVAKKTAAVIAQSEPSLISKIGSSISDFGSAIVSGTKGFFTPSGSTRVQITLPKDLLSQPLPQNVQNKISQLKVGDNISAASAQLKSSTIKDQGNLLDNIFVNAQKYFPETTKSLSELGNNLPKNNLIGLNIQQPVSFKEVSKAVSDTWNTYKDSVIQESERMRALLEAKTPIEKTGAGISLVAQTGNLFFAPITALFTGAKDIPVLGNIVNLITVPFTFVGEAAPKISNSIIDQLPISQEVKDAIKPGIAEIFALAAQIALGKGIDKATGERLSKKYGAEDAQTIKAQAQELAKTANRDLIQRVVNGTGSPEDIKTYQALAKAGMLGEVARKNGSATSAAFKAGVAEFTPQEARDVVIGSNLEKTSLGKELLKQSFIAETQGKNLSIDMVTDSKEVTQFKTPNGLGIKSIALINPQAPAEIGAGQGTNAPISENKLAVQEQIVPKDTPLYRGVSLTSHALKVSADPAASYGAGVYMFENSVPAKDFNDNVVSIQPTKDLKLYTPTEEERMQIIDLSGQEQMNYIKNLLRDTYDGLRIIKPDYYAQGTANEPEIIIYDPKLLKVSDQSVAEAAAREAKIRKNMEEAGKPPLPSPTEKGITPQPQEVVKERGGGVVPSKEYVLKVSTAQTPEEIKAEVEKLGLPEGVLKWSNKSSGKQFSYARPVIGKTELKTLLQNSEEFANNPTLTVIKNKEGNLALAYEGKKMHFEISPDAMNLKTENLLDKVGTKIKIDKSSLIGTEQQMRVETPSGEVFASKESKPLGGFEKTGAVKPLTDFKLFEETKKLVRKYALRIGEGHLPKKTVGVYYPSSKNIRASGMNDLATNVHEIAHAIDHKWKISAKIREVVDQTEDGKPIYDHATFKIRGEMTNLYVKYYPTGLADHPVNTRTTEGFATLVEKYMEMPSTITKEFPDLVKEFLTPEGKYYNSIIEEFLKDTKAIVSNYQGLTELDKIGARVVNDTMETDKSFLNFFEKARTIMEDEIYPLEKLGKMAGTEWSGEDPSLWLRQYSRGGGLYANNILNAKTGYWTLDPQGETRKILPYNWKTLVDSLAKNKQTDTFGYYLVARDQAFEWKELDRLKNIYDKKREIQDVIDSFGTEISEQDRLKAAAQDLGMEVDEVIQIVSGIDEAHKAYLDQQEYLKKNGFTQEEVRDAYTLNQERFAKEAEMYDKLVRADLDLLHNPQVGLVNDEAYARYISKEGYASMKRRMFDDIVGEEKGIMAGAGTGATKISSLKKRSGGQQQIINPILSGMINHIEITKKSLKQVIYNKIGQIAQKGTVGELLQATELRSFPDDSGKITFPQEKDPDIIMARLNYKRFPVLVDKTIKNTVDTVLTFQNMNIFEHLLVSAGRIFTIGTTGAYAPFSLVNYPADQWNAVLNTRNGYKPLVSQIKLLGKAMQGKGGDMAQYWHEWEIMGGDRMTLFQAQLDSTTKAVAYIHKETNGLKKVLNMIDRGVDIASIPAKYSETASRFAEYYAARKAGKPQVVALEEAGRITAPFHHIGSWKFGDKASAKFLIRSIPFANAGFQVVAQAIRTSETPAGRSRLFFVLLAATAAYIASMGMMSLFGSKDQKEQYKDLRPTDIGSYLHFPAIGGSGLIRVRISQEFTTIGTIISMIMAQNLFNVNYSKQDYAEAMTNWIPRQLDIIQPVEMFFSWFNPLIKVPIEVLANFKDYPRISPIEGMGMQAKQPRDRYNEATSLLAKALGNTFNLSPIKIDYLVNQLFGRATGFLTIKPQIYNPISTVDRQYLFTLGRRIENFYDDSTKLDQQIKSMKDKYAKETNIPGNVRTEYAKLKLKQKQYNILDIYLSDYRKIDSKDTKKLEEARNKIIPIMEKLGIN